MPLPTKELLNRGVAITDNFQGSNTTCFFLLLVFLPSHDTQKFFPYDTQLLHYLYTAHPFCHSIHVDILLTPSYALQAFLVIHSTTDFCHSSNLIWDLSYTFSFLTLFILGIPDEKLQELLSTQLLNCSPSFHTSLDDMNIFCFFTSLLHLFTELKILGTATVEKPTVQPVITL